MHGQKSNSSIYQVWSYLVSWHTPVLACASSVGTKRSHSNRIIHEQMEMELFLQLENFGKWCYVSIVLVQSFNHHKLTVGLLLLLDIISFDWVKDTTKIFHIIVLEIHQLACALQYREREENLVSYRRQYYRRFMVIWWQTLLRDKRAPVWMEWITPESLWVFKEKRWYVFEKSTKRADVSTAMNVQ